MIHCVSSKIKFRQSNINGRGLFAASKIDRGEIVIDFKKANGKFLPEKDVDTMFWKKDKDYVLQIGDNLYWATMNIDKPEVCFFLNHSCDPNCGIKDKFQMIAMRDIAREEEITFDYAMSELSNYKMKCNCKSVICRKTITGKDWQIPKLQKKYKRFFSEYIDRKINGI